jgi:hypothetical protein
MELWVNYFQDGLAAVSVVAVIVAMFFRTGTRGR